MDALTISLNIYIFDVVFRFPVNFVNHAAPNWIVPLNVNFGRLLIRADAKFPYR